jgi:RecB family exonuclease
MSTPLVVAQGRATLTLSHSRAQTILTCGKKYQFRYVERIRAARLKEALVFGDVVHKAIAEWLVLRALGLDDDILHIFSRMWSRIRPQEVEWKTYDHNQLGEIGRVLLQKFESLWEQLRYQVLIDRNGNPVVERELSVPIGPATRYLAIIDVVALDVQGNVHVIDFKTPSSPSPEGFAGLSHQLLGQQLVVEKNAQEVLGIDKIRSVGFIELVKRKVSTRANAAGPQVLFCSAPRRSQDDIADFIREMQYVALDIQRQRFARRPMDSYNSPCGSMCEYFGLCTKNDMTGLTRSESFNNQRRSLP